MSESVGRNFSRYIGPADLHDGTILSLEEPRPGTVTVRVRGASGKEHYIVFTEAIIVTSVEAIGMMLYALAEFAEAGGARLFAFANWDEDDSAQLEIRAGEVTFDTGPAAA